jgi:hypothetical protein
MNINLLDMYSKIVELLGESAEQYSDDAVYWNIDYDNEYCIRIILSNNDDKVKLLIDYVSLTYDDAQITTTNKINTIIGYAKMNDITIN